MDISRSVSDDQWEKEKTFAKEISKLVDISESGGHVSVLRFDEYPYFDIKFDDFMTYDDFSTALDQLVNDEYQTNIYGALRSGLDEMFTSGNGMRSHSSKMMILITDGKSDDSQFDDIRMEYQGKDIKLVIVGVGDVDESSLRKLVVSNKDLYIASNFNELLDKVTKKLGESIKTGKLSRTNSFSSELVLIIIY